MHFTLLVLVVSAAVLVKCTSSLQCWNCVDGEPHVPDIPDCSKPDVQQCLPGVDWCSTLLGNDTLSGETARVRGCSNKPESFGDKDCGVLSTLGQIGCVCYCKTNLCNDADFPTC